jgi:hypothetical protein
MDNPTEEITGVVHQLCQGTPAEQVRGAITVLSQTPC